MRARARWQHGTQLPRASRTTCARGHRSDRPDALVPRVDGAARDRVPGRAPGQDLTEGEPATLQRILFRNG